MLHYIWSLKDKVDTARPLSLEGKNSECHNMIKENSIYAETSLNLNMNN